MAKSLTREWALCLCTLALSSYVMLASLLYQHKKKTTSRVVRTTNLLCSITSALIWVSVLPAAAELVLIPLDFDPCEWTFRSGVSLILLHKSSVYVSLWFRLYSTFQAMQTRRVELIACALLWSKVVLAGIVFFLCSNLLFSVFIKVHALVDGCKYEPLYPAAFYANNVAFVLCRVAIVTLLVVALRICYSEVSGMVITCMRLLVCASFCVASELLFLLSVEFLPKANKENAGISPSLVVCLVLFNSLILTVALLCSFSDYRDRIFPLRLTTQVGIAPSQFTQPPHGNSIVPRVFVNSIA